MSAILAEPVTPELVLVCPELREAALAALDDAPWRTLAALPAAPLELPVVSRQRMVPLAEMLAAFLAFPLLAFACATLLTLLLTVAANAGH